MTAHVWAKFTMATIEVEPQESGNLHTYLGEVAEEVGEDMAVLACALCGTELSTASYDTECALEVTPQNS